MPSMPALSTIDYWMGSMRDDQKERYAQAPIMGQHCRAGQHERRFAIPMNESFRLTSDLETCVVTNIQTSRITPLKASMFSGMSITHSLCSQRLSAMLIVFGGESGGGKERNTYVLQTSNFHFTAILKYFILSDWRRHCLATQRLLACYFVVHCRLFRECCHYSPWRQLNILHISYDPNRYIIPLRES